ncbi:hypothetical protein AMAG_19547 [Allomyces macrogynus ATCC 38327]|uniref:Uncharacterized protein n=1 Tax=Allomyces macrogynus (strain ATCC 38327) TaxID=578462 RepID=A0A0L0SWE9_ALLM3|nr:hypothetical protein AMAG_19547 [Allomyces macrogynus ATCC 38327]|eukprot:KNE66898.1 hypothetical protein AMAG_19547 [Allomyces macrogynus ATCC 38327]
MTDDVNDEHCVGATETATMTPAPTHGVVVLNDWEPDDDQPLSTAAPAAVGAELVTKSPARTGRRRAHVVSDSDGNGDSEGDSAPVITSSRSRTRSKRSRHITSDSDSDDTNAPVAKVRRRAPPVIGG